MKAWINKHLIRGIALVSCIGLYVLTVPISASARQKHTSAQQFAFHQYTLPDVVNHPTFQFARPVNPSLKHISGWVSGVGAAVAVGDLSQNTLPDDIAYVDTRTNQVIVAPAPGTGHRFKPFALNPYPLKYNSKTMAPTGVQIADLNGDGQPDIIVYYWGRAPIVFMKKSGYAGKPLKASMFVRQNLVQGNHRWYTDAMTISDLTGNAHLDIIVGNYFPNGSHVLGPGPAVDMQRGMSDATNGGKLEVLQWTSGNGGNHPWVRYRIVPNAVPAKDSYGWCLGLGSIDLTPNLLPEIYVANDFGPDHLLYNVSSRNHIKFKAVMGAKSWLEPKSYELGRDSFKGMGVASGDLTANGRLDIFVSNIGSKFALLESNFAWMNTGSLKDWAKGIAPFINKSDQMNLAHSGWAWGAAIGYFNNSIYPQIVQASGFLRGKSDGWAEIQQLATGNDALLSNPNTWPVIEKNYSLDGSGELRFYVKTPNGDRYANIGSNLNISDTNSRAIAVADVLGNGRENFAVANQWGASKFYLNVGHYRPHYMELRLMLPRGTGNHSIKVLSGHPNVSNVVPAQTATVEITVSRGHELFGQVDDSGKRDTNIFFSLGPKRSGEHTYVVKVRWRTTVGTIRSAQLHLKAGYYTVLL